MPKRLALKSILWFLTAVGGTEAILRFKSGLGASTALSDATPWGFWIGFDVISGVALAAGGFVMAAIVYIFHVKQCKPLLRPAILTAFLGYVIVALGLMVDLGLPWNIWHPMIFWQYRSVLFEVAMCVMLYLTVLALEVAPVVLEHPFFGHPLFRNIYKALRTFTIPLVLLGIMLSTLHQSSLGSLFLIMPFRVHPLWYSHIIYLLYFVSAMSLGCSMIIFESTVTSFVYDHHPRIDLLRILGRISSALLGAYLVLRLSDLVVRGQIHRAFDGSHAAMLFWFELLISTIVPAILFNFSKVNRTVKGLFATAAMVVFGFILNRQDIFLTMARRGPLYVPLFGELMVSIALVSGAALVVFFFVEHFDLFMEGLPDTSGADDAFKPGRSILWNVRPGENRFAMFSISVIAGIGLALAFSPASAIYGYTYPKTPVQRAVGWDTLLIDGNRAKEAVLFPHERHKKLIGLTRDSCISCHHMSMPHDGPTACGKCHKDMYLPTSIFDHRYHQARLGGNKSCHSCHINSKAKKEVVSCSARGCHEKMFKSDTSSYIAPSYLDAMHIKCKGCHEKEAQKADSLRQIGDVQAADSLTILGRCSACHPGLPDSAVVKNPFY